MKKILMLILVILSLQSSDTTYAGNPVILPIGGRINRDQSEPQQEGMSCPHIPLTRPWYAIFQDFSTGGLFMVIIFVIFILTVQPENHVAIRVIGSLLFISSWIFTLWIDYSEKKLFESYKKRCPKEAKAWGIYKTEMEKKDPTLENIINELEAAGYNYDSLKEINGSVNDVMFCGCK